MDALTQLLEAYVCSRANPMTDALCRAGLPLVAKALPQAWRNPGDTAAREDLSLGALWSGIALGNAGLGAVHGFAGPLGGMFSAPHGAVCAALLAPVMRANIEALRARSPDNAALRRYDEIACWLTGRAEAGAEDGIRFIEALVTELNIPKLGTFGLTKDRISDVVVQAQQASSMKANPLVLTLAELAGALAEAL
jgi:alcohol dehydrogenase class IV